MKKKQRKLRPKLSYFEVETHKKEFEKAVIFYI